jgi:Na+-driven multidrug efflux pump
LNVDSQPGWSENVIIEKARLLRISNLALPIIAGALATNLMGFVDTTMVA